MPTEETKRRQFLIVDDDPQFLATVTASLKAMSEGRWAFRTATNHTQALEHLKAQPVDTIVLDIEMPVMDGIEFLRLLGRRYPGQQVVMLSGRLDEGARKTSMELGASLFLEKPVSTAGFGDLYTALDALTGPAPQTGFRGVMQRIGLDDVLQMECLNRKSSVLVVTAGNRRGQIFVADGEIVHAQCGQLQGEMALYSLLGLQGGEFALQAFTEPPRRTISGQYQFLLMEAARLRDEAGLEPARERRGVWSATDFGAASAETLTPTEARGARIEEVLLCSSAGEVLYQSKCESVESRLEIFKQLELQAMQAAKGTPSGRFHRVTMETGNSRLLMQIQPAFKLLVRSALPEQPATNE
jgi:CheY-like chemotaxis protein